MPTTPKKKAVRRVKRGPNGKLIVVFYDADTGYELTDLSDYEVLDQGALPSTTSSDTTDAIPTPAGGGGSSNASSGSSNSGGEPFDWYAFQNRPGASRGTGNIVEDLKRTLTDLTGVTKPDPKAAITPPATSPATSPVGLTTTKKLTAPGYNNAGTGATYDEVKAFNTTSSSPSIQTEITGPFTDVDGIPVMFQNYLNIVAGPMTTKLMTGDLKTNLVDLLQRTPDSVFEHAAKKIIETNSELPEDERMEWYKVSALISMPKGNLIQAVKNLPVEKFQEAQLRYGKPYTKTEVQTEVQTGTHGKIPIDNTGVTSVGQSKYFDKKEDTVFVPNKGPTFADVESFNSKTTPSGTSAGLINPTVKTPDGVAPYTGGITPGIKVARNVTIRDTPMVRDLPFRDTMGVDLAAVMYAVDPSLTAVINSAGQVSVANGGVAGVDRIGVTTVNHDVRGVKGQEQSYAFDVQFFDANGKQQTPANNPKLLGEIAKYAVIAGFTQTGMGGGIVHLGKDPKETPGQRKWSYPEGTAVNPIILDGINAGKQIVASGQANEIYLKMVTAVSAESPLNAPLPRPDPRNAAPITATATGNAALGIGVDARLQALLEPFKQPPANDSLFPKFTDPFAPLFETIGEFFNPQETNVYSPTVAGRSDVISDNTFNQTNAAISEDPLIKEIMDALPTGTQTQLNAVRPEGSASGMPAAPTNMVRPEGPIGSLPATPTDMVRPSGSIGSLPAAPIGSQSPAQLQQNMGFMKAKDNTGNTTETSALTGPYSLNDPDRRDKVIYTILGEAVGEGMEGMTAVANVIKNRALSGDYPTDPKDVVTQKRQFSPWNPATQGGNIDSIMAAYPPNSKEYKQALQIAELVFSGQLPDNTGKSVFFHRSDLTPYWADEVQNEHYGTVQIGNHTFYPQSDVGAFSAKAPSASSLNKPASGTVKNDAYFTDDEPTRGFMEPKIMQSESGQAAKAADKNPSTYVAPASSQPSSSPISNTGVAQTVSKGISKASNDSSNKSTYVEGQNATGTGFMPKSSPTVTSPTKVTSSAPKPATTSSSTNTSTSASKTSNTSKPSTTSTSPSKTSNTSTSGARSSGINNV